MFSFKVLLEKESYFIREIAERRFKNCSMTNAPKRP